MLLPSISASVNIVAHGLRMQESGAAPVACGGTAKP